MTDEELLVIRSQDDGPTILFTCVIFILIIMFSQVNNF